MRARQTRKTFLAVALSASLAAFAFAPSAYADGGLIHFSGQVTAATCKVQGNGTMDSDFTVSLPTVSASTLAPGETAGRTQFSMRLVDCDAVDTGVRAYFEGGPNVDPTHRSLIPMGGGDIHFVLFDAEGDQIDIGAPSQRVDAPHFAANTEMRYEVAYRNVGALTAPAGYVDASVAYSLDYL